MDQTEQFIAELRAELKAQEKVQEHEKHAEGILAFSLLFFLASIAVFALAVAAFASIPGG